MTKVPIKCIKCGTIREVHKSCLKIVKRCKPCQIMFNRDAARNRYRQLNGIPVEKPIKKVKKEKEKEKEKEIELVQNIPNNGYFSNNEGGGFCRGTESTAHNENLPRTPEETARRAATIEKLLDLLNDETTVNDW
jgi:hypothetical protein